MEDTITNKEDWVFEITPNRKLIDINLKEIWRYRDLLVLFIRRNIVSVYKQTILGPLWFIIQPLLTSITQFIIFAKVANIPTDDVPPFLFLLSGNILWGYFSTSFTESANTFKGNAGIFGKVYFPRAIMPIVTVASGLFKFIIQYVLFLVFLFMAMYKGANVHPNMYVLATPVLILVMALISMGFGMVITSMTTKYRDFSYLMGFAVSLFMYMTPIVYPTSLLIEKIESIGYPGWLAFINPLTGLIDVFKYAYLGSGTIFWPGVIWSCTFAVVIYFFGLIVFNRTEKSFMDTI